MQPGFDLRLRTMIKALAETVLPAVDPFNKAAIEQAHLVLGSLELLRQQIDYAYWFEVADARSMSALVDSLAAVPSLPSGTEAKSIAARSLVTAGRPDNCLSVLRECNRKLRDAISLLIQEASAVDDAEIQKQVRTLVLEHGETQIARERAFVAGTHFDVFPDNLGSIEQTLSCASRLAK